MRDIKLLIFAKIILFATQFLPEDAKQTWAWLSKMPIEK